MFDKIYVFTYLDLFLILDNYTLFYQESDLLIHSA
jgi:hypothetical protein